MSEEKPPFALRTVIIVAVGGWVLWGLFALLVAFGFASENAMVVAGQIGDLFGGINALFSALAFAMVWWSGDMQRRELSLQRQDLQLQLEELKAQRDELIETRSVFKRQNFEAAFFQQISLLRDMIPHFRSGERSGEEAIQAIGRTCASILRSEGMDADKVATDEGYRRSIVEFYEKLIYQRHENQLGSYFRTLYHTFKLLNSQDISEDDKVIYANLLRAQIGSSMLVILSANLLSPLGEGFLPLVEKYGVLKHMPSGLVRIRRVLPRNAFLGTEERISS